MEEQNQDQPQPTNPRLTRRKWLRWLAVPAALAVLALVYQLTRPPELVWWRSPALTRSNHHVNVMMPNGWRVDETIVADRRDISYFVMLPIDRQPSFLRFIFPPKNSNSMIWLAIEYDPAPRTVAPTSLSEEAPPTAERSIGSPGLYVRIGYQCDDHEFFNRTYKQICDSLTIE